jgi:acyl carrier protein
MTGAFSLQEDASSILVDAPLARLGLDSLQGMQLHSLLEERFAVAVPEFVMFDKETTLTVGSRTLVL